MFEFQKLCSEVEKLTPADRGLLVADKALTVVRGLKALDIPGLDAVGTLLGFIVGSAVSDGTWIEKDYRRIYPVLVELFGDTYSVPNVKRALRASKDIKKDIKEYTKQVHSIITSVDEQLGADVVMLCLLVVSADGKVSLKERNYIRQLCRS